LKRTAVSAVILMVGLLAVGNGLWAEERFPPPDFESAYRMPVMDQPAPDSRWEGVSAVIALAAALVLAAVITHRLRSRRAMAVLSVASLIYFGFIREGCICPVGSTQHVTLSLFDGAYVLPLTVALFFALPLAFALFYGRVFCAGVCPLGAAQDVVLIKPVKVPGALAQALGLLPYLYLGLAVLAVLNGSGFLICRYDPFVSFFRRSGPMTMLVTGAVIIGLSTFVGRPYCRFLCPYAVLLRLCSRWTRRRVTTTPDECVVGGLCETSCPFGAIHPPTPQGVSEE
jgi:NosR/NirI family nitrous oxide reductase transcriptional regulator